MELKPDSYEEQEEEEDEEDIEQSPQKDSNSDHDRQKSAEPNIITRPRSGNDCDAREENVAASHANEPASGPKAAVKGPSLPLQTEDGRRKMSRSSHQLSTVAVLSKSFRG